MKNVLNQAMNHEISEREVVNAFYCFKEQKNPPSAIFKVQRNRKFFSTNIW